MIRSLPDAKVEEKEVGGCMGVRCATCGEDNFPF